MSGSDVSGIADRVGTVEWPLPAETVTAACAMVHRLAKDADDEALLLGALGLA